MIKSRQSRLPSYFMSQKLQQNKVYTVSLLNKEIRFLLEQNFVSLMLSGEISNFVAPSSGHWYFTLKDDYAQIKAAMWRGNNRSARFKPKNGDQVLVRARVSLYEPRGDYQLIVEHIEPAGVGLLKQEFEALQMKLASEGLFNTGYKKPLPPSILKVGIITSATGAAVKDIIKVLKQRAPHIEVVIYPAQVQGDGAAEQLITQINLANQRNDVDVLIVGRGGGSLEDLWCFNNENLARTIFSSQLPIVSAVGHEIDTTIADYVADIRAATPSQAAEIVSPDNQHLTSQLLNWQQRLQQAMQNQLAHAKHKLSHSRQHLALYHPEARLQQQTQLRDELEIRLHAALQKHRHSAIQQLNHLQQRLQRVNPMLRVQHAKTTNKQLLQRLTQANSAQLEDAQKQLAVLCAKLDATSPLAVLARGYSVTNHNHKVVSSVSNIKVGDTLTTQVADGHIVSEVRSIDHS